MAQPYPGGVASRPIDTTAGTTMLERESPLATIADRVARAANGEPSLLIVEGAAGLGKSALLAEARRSIEPSD